MDLIPGREAAGSYRLTEGPWSAAYGSKATAPVVCYEKQAALPAEFAAAVAVLQPATAAGRLEEIGRLEDVGDTASKSGGLSAYLYNGGNRSVLALFSDSEGRWRWREWSSDATFLAIETDATGREFRRVFLAGGSFLESSQGRVLNCRGKVECWEWLRGTHGEQVYCSNPEAVEHVATEALAPSSPPSGESS